MLASVVAGVSLETCSVLSCVAWVTGSAGVVSFGTVFTLVVGGVAMSAVVDLVLISVVRGAVVVAI